MLKTSKSASAHHSSNACKHQSITKPTTASVQAERFLLSLYIQLPPCQRSQSTTVNDVDNSGNNIVRNCV